LPNHSWTDKISNPAQIGGIETSILDNGAAKGTRIAWINTGTGFRYKVVLDRAMDIMDAFFNQHSLSWLSHGGITYPQPFSNRGIEWLKTFGGGLLTTCGLSHVGGPEADEYGERRRGGVARAIRGGADHQRRPQREERAGRRCADDGDRAVDRVGGIARVAVVHHLAHGVGPVFEDRRQELRHDRRVGVERRTPRLDRRRVRPGAAAQRAQR